MKIALAFTLTGETAERFAAIMREHEGCACGESYTADQLAESLLEHMLSEDAEAHNDMTYSNVVPFQKIH